MRFDCKQDCINYIIEEIKKYNFIDEKKLIKISDILWKKDYDDLYRLANMIDRFGLDIIMEVTHN